MRALTLVITISSFILSKEELTFYPTVIFHFQKSNIVYKRQASTLHPLAGLNGGMHKESGTGTESRVK